MNSIGARLTLWYVVVITGTVAAVFLLGRVLLEIEMERGIDLLHDTEFEVVSTLFASDLKGGRILDIKGKFAAHARFDAPLYFFQIRDGTGQVCFHSDNLGEIVLPPNPRGVDDWDHAAGKLGDLRISVYDMSGYTLQIASSLSNLRQLFSSYDTICLSLLGLVAGLSCFLGYRLARLALNPIRRIQRAASRISAENLQERIPVSGSGDEISDLAILLNEMFDRLELAFGRLSRFAGEASHELKTPLSIIRLQSEKLILHADLTPVQQELMQQQLENLGRLNQIIEKMLFLARTEVGQTRLKTKEQDTAEFIQSLVEDALVLCEERELRFELVRNDSARTKFDPALLRQVLLNLLSNAIKATPPHGDVRLTSKIEGRFWRVWVEDTGPGVPAHMDTEYLFKPFVRLESKPDPFSGGSGLGLAICRGIIELHHGSIHAESPRGKPGLTIVFEVPLVPMDGESHDRREKDIEKSRATVW